MDINKVNDIIFNVLLFAGILGPIYVWLRAFESYNKIIRIITFVIYVGVQCLWFQHLWFIWFPVSVITIILLIGIDIRYGNHINQLVVEKR